MKILYIGSYRENNSFGRVCRDYLLSLIEAGADVACRPVFHSQPFVSNLDQKILACESKSSLGAEICIQQLRHPQLLPDQRFKKNIAIVGFNAIPSESQNSQIADSLYFDDVICTNRHSTLVAGKLGDVIYQHPVTIKRTEEKLPINDKFIFYFIGKLSQRKNLDTLITAFHREFHRDEPVELLIKTTCDIDPQQAQKIIDAHFVGIKGKLGRYDRVEKYKNEKVMLGNVADDNWDIVHNTGNCLVCPSYGEYTSLLPNLALAYGNQVIVNDTIGLADVAEVAAKRFVDICAANYINVEDSKCSNLTNFEGEKGSKWYEIGIRQLQDAMRAVYTMPVDATTKMPTHKEIGEQLLARILK